MSVRFCIFRCCWKKSRNNVEAHPFYECNISYLIFIHISWYFHFVLSLLLFLLFFSNFLVDWPVTCTFLGFKTDYWSCLFSFPHKPFSFCPVWCFIFGHAAGVYIHKLFALMRRRRWTDIFALHSEAWSLAGSHTETPKKSQKGMHRNECVTITWWQDRMQISWRHRAFPL